MCDERTLKDNKKHLSKKGGITRRQFNKLTAGAGLAMMLPRVANAQEVTETEVMIPTPDGMADAVFIRPTSGSHPAVLYWPDILGLRPAFRMMGRRLAESGYSVLVVNPYYRNQRAPVVQEGASFADEAVRNTVFPLARTLNPETHATDARAFIDYLDQQDSVDTSALVGTAGYCMSGPMALRTAATVPERVGAAASFHGGGLATDGEDSPHLLIPQMNDDAGFLIAIAENDDAEEPEVKDVLREAFEDANVDAEIEVYEDTLHGWTVLDSDIYHEMQAERAWSRMLDLFEQKLT